MNFRGKNKLHESDFFFVVVFCLVVLCTHCALMVLVQSFYICSLALRCFWLFLAIHLVLFSGSRGFYERCEVELVEVSCLVFSYDVYAVIFSSRRQVVKSKSMKRSSSAIRSEAKRKDFDLLVIFYQYFSYPSVQKSWAYFLCIQLSGRLFRSAKLSLWGNVSLFAFRENFRGKSSLFLYDKKRLDLFCPLLLRET